MNESLAIWIKRRAKELGFALAGVAKAEALPADLARLEQWIRAEHHGTMAYMARHPERRADPRITMPTARSIVMLAMTYGRPDDAGPRPSPHHGRIASYARGRDYHLVIEEKLTRLAEDIAEHIGHPIASKKFIDAGPLLERAYAQRAGLGFVGKNTCLIHPELGSNFFIAALALDVELRTDDPVDGTCGRCTRCLDACPTQAFTAPGELDARRCISYVTIETKTPPSPEIAANMAPWVFGCDVCQDVCPYNKFAPEAGDTAFDGPAWIDLRDLLAIRANSDYNEQTRERPLERPRRRGMQRSAAIVWSRQLMESGASQDERLTAAATLRQLASTELEHPELAAQFLEAAANLEHGSD